LFFFILATISLFSNGSTYLGSNAIIGILIAVVFAYYMGLYSNEMPENGVNGFTPQITLTAKQASLIRLDKNKLVAICKHIAIDGTEMDKIINENKGTFRKIIPKETGGSITNNDIIVPTVTEPIKNNIRNKSNYNKVVVN
jgi:hypothetical protein